MMPSAKYKPVGKAASQPKGSSKPEVKKIRPPACWLEDFEAEVSVNADGRYSLTFDSQKVRKSYNFPRKFKIIVPTKRLDFITVEVRFRIDDRTPAESPSSKKGKESVRNAKMNLLKGIKSHWNGKFKLEINDPVCGRKILPVRYVVKWVDSNQHYDLVVHETWPREGVTGLIMDVSKTTLAWTYAHEFGHCVGLPDEYSYLVGGGTVQYYKPDGSLDDPITAPFDGKAISDPTATIMAAFNCVKLLPRHAWNIATEAQALLRTKIGRQIICEIK